MQFSIFRFIFTVFAGCPRRSHNNNIILYIMLYCYNAGLLVNTEKNEKKKLKTERYSSCKTSVWQPAASVSTRRVILYKLIRLRSAVIAKQRVWLYLLQTVYEIKNVYNILYYTVDQKVKT